MTNMGLNLFCNFYFKKYQQHGQTNYKKWVSTPVYFLYDINGYCSMAVSDKEGFNMEEYLILRIFFHFNFSQYNHIPRFFTGNAIFNFDNNERGNW